MVSKDILTNIYNRWGDKEKLQLGCALEEQMFNDNLSTNQRQWLKRFSKVWEYTQDKEYKNFINNKKTT